MGEYSCYLGMYSSHGYTSRDALNLLLPPKYAGANNKWFCSVSYKYHIILNYDNQYIFWLFENKRE